MNEKLEKKLKKILAKAGLDEDQIDGIVDEVEGALAEEVPTEEEGDPEESAVPPSEDEGAAPVPPVEEEVPPTPEGEVPPEEVPPSDDVPPTDGSIEGALEELAAQEGEAAPQPDVPLTPDEVNNPAPAVPAVDPAQVQQLVNDLQEANKTIDGLVARVESLEQALKDAGVITGTSQVGDETPRITPNANADHEDAFDDILDVINGK